MIKFKLKTLNIECLTNSVLLNVGMYLDEIESKISVGSMSGVTPTER